jgi:hypothetical protein
VLLWLRPQRRRTGAQSDNADKVAGEIGTVAAVAKFTRILKVRARPPDVGVGGGSGGCVRRHPRCRPHPCRSAGSPQSTGVRARQRCAERPAVRHGGGLLLCTGRECAVSLSRNPATKPPPPPSRPCCGPQEAEETAELLSPKAGGRIDRAAVKEHLLSPRGASGGGGGGGVSTSGSTAGGVLSPKLMLANLKARAAARAAATARGTADTGPAEREAGGEGGSALARLGRLTRSDSGGGGGGDAGGSAGDGASGGVTGE